jgi:hypothetical protein
MSSPDVSGIRVVLSLVFCILFSASLFVLLFFVLYCLSFFD